MSEIPTASPDQEPEYVGAHSSLVARECENYIGETTEDIGRCGERATHTVVMFTGKLHQISSCDGCGEPQDAKTTDRQWSGEIVDGNKPWQTATPDGGKE